MSGVGDRARQVLPEVMQEAVRLAGPNGPPPMLTIRLKRSDPCVQDLLGLVARLASEIRTESGLVIKREAISGAAEAVLSALRRCGVPIDALMREAGVMVTNGVGALGVGLGVLSAFGGAFGGKAQDNIKAMSDMLQAVRVQEK